MHILALSAFAVLQGRMKVLVWSYGETSHAMQFGRNGTFVRLHWNGNLGLSAGLYFNVKMLLGAPVVIGQ